MYTTDTPPNIIFDEYAYQFKDHIKMRLQEIRSIILATIPDTQELINYGILAFTLVPNGKREEQIMIAGYAKHIGLYPHPTTIEHCKGSLDRYGLKYSKGAVQLPHDKELPNNLIKHMILWRKKQLTS